jgi:translation initiation factor IF-1
MDANKGWSVSRVGLTQLPYYISCRDSFSTKFEIHLEIIMPGKKKGGKRKNNMIKTRRLEDIMKDYDPKTYEVYGQTLKPLGNRRFSVKVQMLHNPSELQGTIICSIKGSYRRRINPDMFVLVKLYDFNTDQGQIIDSYTQDEVDALRSADKWDYPSTNSNLGEKATTDDYTGMQLPPDSDSDTDTEEEAVKEDQIAELMGVDLDIDAI